MLSKHHRDSPPDAKASRWNLSKFVVIKHFGWESLNVQPSCCLDVVVYMLNCVFWRHILLEIEFKSRVDMGSDSNRYSVQRYSPWAAAQLSTPKKTKKPQKTPPKKNQKRGHFKTPPRLQQAEQLMRQYTIYEYSPLQLSTLGTPLGTIWIFVYYAVYGSRRGRCRNFLVLNWGGSSFANMGFKSSTWNRKNCFSTTTGFQHV